MLPKKIIYSFFFFLFVGIGLSYGDSCKKGKLQLDNAKKAFLEGDYKGARRKIKNFIRSEHEEECPTLFLDSKYLSATMDIYSGNYAKAFENVTESLLFIENSEHLNEEEKLKYEGSFRMVLGEYYLELKRFTEAAKEYEKSLDLFHKSNQKDRDYDITKAVREINLAHANLLKLASSNHKEKKEKTVLDEQFAGEVSSIDKNLNSLPELEELKSYKRRKKVKRVRAYGLLYKAEGFIENYNYSNNPSLLDSVLMITNRVDSLNQQGEDILERLSSSRIHLMNQHLRVKVFSKKADQEALKNELMAIVDYPYGKLGVVYYGGIDDLLKTAIKNYQDTLAYTFLKDLELVEAFDNKYYNKLFTEIEASSQEIQNLNKESLDLKKENKALEDKIAEGDTYFFSMSIIALLILLTISWYIYEVITKKRQVEKELGTLEFQNQKNIQQQAEILEQTDFLRLLHKNSDTLSQYIKENNSSDSINVFMKKAIEETYAIAQSAMDLDVLGIGIYNDKNKAIKLFAIEDRENTGNAPSPDEPIVYKLNEKNRLPIYIFKGENNRDFIEPNFKENYHSYFKTLKKSKAGEHSSSIIYIKIGELGVITAQSQKKYAYRTEHYKLLKTIGENVFFAIENIRMINKNNVIIKQLAEKEKHLEILRRDTSHRIKNHIGALVRVIGLQLEKEEVENDAVATTSLLKIKGRTQAILTIHNMIHQKWGDEDEDQKFISPQNYFTNLAQALFQESFAYEANQIDLNIDLKKEPSMHVEILKDLGAVVVELALNVFEHAYKNGANHWIHFSAKVVRTENSAELQLVIGDKGMGMKEAAINKEGSKGLKLLKKLLKRLKGKISPPTYWEPTEKKGTKRIITLPVK